MRNLYASPKWSFKTSRLTRKMRLCKKKRWKCNISRIMMTTRLEAYFIHKDRSFFFITPTSSFSDDQQQIKKPLYNNKKKFTMVIHSYHTAVVSRAIQMKNKKKNIVCIAEFPLFELSARIIMRRKKNKIWKHTNPTRQWENLGQGWFVLNQRQQQQQEEKQIIF